MIEWWQALLISLVSGVTSGLLTGGAALFIQRRQHGHEIAMQGQRLDAERAAEEHEAIRQMRRERLRPVFELLDELEVWYGVAIERKTLEEVRSLPPEKLPPDKLPAGISAEMWPTVVQKVLDGIEGPKTDFLQRAGRLSFRVGDRPLGLELILLVAAVFPELPSPDVSPLRVADFRERLEQYAARVSASS